MKKENDEIAGLAHPGARYECRLGKFGAYFHDADAGRDLSLSDVLEILERNAGWRPIETAPRDGTRILVFTHYDKYGPLRVVVGAMFSHGAWRRTPVTSAEALNPSHWMPLPTAPDEGLPIPTAALVATPPPLKAEDEE